MSVKLRLKKIGRRNKPFYRIVAADSRMPRDGRYLEEIGIYQPLNDEPKIEVKEERAMHWLLNGAIPSETVRSLLRKKGILKRLHEEKLKRKGKTHVLSDAS